MKMRDGHDPDDDDDDSSSSSSDSSDSDEEGSVGDREADEEDDGAGALGNGTSGAGRLAAGGRADRSASVGRNDAGTNTGVITGSFDMATDSARPDDALVQKLTSLIDTLDKGFTAYADHLKKQKEEWDLPPKPSLGNAPAGSYPAPRYQYSTKPDFKTLLNTVSYVVKMKTLLQGRWGFNGVQIFDF